ncbi:MAG: hypothetical protein JW709_03815 [Sedimentisphaerales bacterium]|nr:hypothetical protein [Sedimentisphaerales bacterium]
MKDERIQTTTNRMAAIGFFIWNLLLPISLCYRILILKQYPSQWWDIAAIWIIGIFVVFIANAGKGGLDYQFKKKFFTIGIIIVIAIAVILFIMGMIHSIADLGGVLIGSISGVGLVIVVAYLLNRRWRRKAGFENEP